MEKKEARVSDLSFGVVKLKFRPLLEEMLGERHLAEPKLYFNNRLYRHSDTNKSSISYSCVRRKWKDVKCTGSARTSNGMVEELRPHTSNCDIYAEYPF